MSEEEVWKDVIGYEGLYQVSNLGRVKSLLRGGTEGKILCPLEHRQGYLHVRLCKKGVYKQFSIHRLVAITYLDNPNNFLEVNHIDENKKNNRVDNLEWCNNRYNVNYGTGILRNKLKHQKQVKQFDIEGNLIDTFESIQEASKVTKVHYTNIGRCCNNKRKTAGGYIWKYA